MKLITLYDNQAREKFKAGWGFSCLLKLEEQTILFDTGADVETLAYNARLLEIDKDKISHCFISHDHYDHTGGIGWLSPKTKVVFPDQYKGEISQIDAMVFDLPIKEQTVIVKPNKVMLVGCSHPGIVRMANAVYEKYGKLKLIIGGFHLLGKSEREVSEMAKVLLEKTELIAPCHCTGESAIKVFEEVFGKRFIENYAGKIIEI